MPGFWDIANAIQSNVTGFGPVAEAFGRAYRDVGGPDPSGVVQPVETPVTEQQSPGELRRLVGTPSAWKKAEADTVQQIGQLENDVQRQQAAGGPEEIIMMDKERIRRLGDRLSAIRSHMGAGPIYTAGTAATPGQRSPATPGRPDPVVSGKTLGTKALPGGPKKQRVAPVRSGLGVAQVVQQVEPGKLKEGEVKGAFAPAEQALKKESEQQSRIGMLYRQQEGAVETAVDLFKDKIASGGERYSSLLKQVDAEKERHKQLFLDAYSTGVDPQRFWSQMPTTNKVIGLLAVAMGGFTEGFTQGRVKNRALNVLQRAIDRDVAAQKSNIAQRINALNLSGKQRQYLTGRLDKVEDNLRVNIEKQLNLRMQGLALQEKRLHLPIGMLQKQFKLKLNYLQAIKGCASGQSKTIVTKKRFVTGGGVNYKKMKQLPNDLKNSIVAAHGDVKILRRILGDIKKHGGVGKGTIASLFPWTESALTKGDSKAMALRMSAAMNRGRPTDKDTRYVEGLIPNPAKDTKYSAAKKARKLISYFTTRIRGYEKVYPADVYDTRPFAAYDPSEGTAPAAAAKGKAK